MIEAGLGVSLLNKVEIESWTGNVKIMKTEPEVIFRIGIMYPDLNDMTIAARQFIKEIL